MTQTHSVNVYSKLVVVKNLITDNSGAYILYLIPTAEYYRKYPKQVNERFINCGDHSDFSGIACYVIPNLNRII